jgi:hypothetical protein
MDDRMSTHELEIHYADGRRERRQLAPGRYRVGREVGDLVLAHPSVSGHHADLEVTEQYVRITDAGSTNGTFAPDGARLAGPYTLLPAQSVRLGECRLTWLAPAAVAGRTQVMPQVRPAGGTQVMAQVSPAALPAAPVPHTVQQPVVAQPAIAISGKAAIVLGLALVAAVAIFVTGFAGGEKGSNKKARYENFSLEYKCWQNVVGIFVGPSRCEANVNGNKLVDGEIKRFEDKLFNEGWELVTATESGLWTTKHFRREKD